jgi:hypothetical protein
VQQGHLENGHYLSVHVTLQKTSLSFLNAILFAESEVSFAFNVN